MFDNFDLKHPHKRLVGYIWDIENPLKVMVVVHGIGEHAGRYDRMAGILNKAGIAVVSMDLQGHGISSGKRGHTFPSSEILKDISMLIDWTKAKYPNIPIVLYGHSMGGLITLNYRARGSENHVPEKYIISAPWLKLVMPIPKPLLKAVEAVAKITPTLAISSGCKAKDLGNIEITRDYDTDPLVHPSITIGTAIECQLSADRLLSGTEENNLRAEDKPFLLMHGDGDKICSVEGSRILAERYKDNPNFTYVELPGYYHEIHNGGPNATGEDVIEAIKDFVLK